MRSDKGGTYKYIGCFVDRGQLMEIVNKICSQRLDRIIKHPHVTFIFRPETVDESLFGKQLEVTVTGYGNDGKNEGVKVELRCADPKISQMIGQIKVPHITISVDKSSRSVDTAGLDFKEVESAVLKATFGGYIHMQGPVLAAPDENS